MTPRARDHITVCRPITISAFALGIAGLQLLPVLPDTTFSIFLLCTALTALLCRPKHALWAALCIGFCYASLWSVNALSQRLPLPQSGSADLGMEFLQELAEAAIFCFKPPKTGAFKVV